MVNKDLYKSILIRFFDSFLKFSLYLTMPLLIGFINTSEIQIFISIIFISSVFLRFSSEEILLKKLSNLNFSLKEFNDFVRSTIKIIFFSYVIFYILIQILIIITNDFNNNLVLQIIHKYYYFILLNSFIVTLISIISFGFRAIGKINLCIILQGSTWPFIILTLLIIKPNDEYNFEYLITYFSLFFSLIGLIAVVYFYNHILSFKKKDSITVKNELKFDRKSSYIQSISGLFLNWVPLIIFGLFNDSYTTGIFGTYFKIGVGIFYFLLVIDFNAGKILSINFQTNKKNELIKNFDYYQKFYIFFSIFTFIGSLIFLHFFNTFFETSLYNLIFFIFLFIILISSIFGPVDISFLMINKERMRSKCAILFIISVLLIFTPITFFYNYDHSLYVFGVLFFLNYLIKYKIIKKELNRI